MVDHYQGVAGDIHVAKATIGDGGHPQFLTQRYYFDSLETMIPITKFPGCKPSQGNDMTDAIEAALNSGEGGWYYASVGDYQIDGTINITRSDVGLWMSPGAVFRGNHPGSAANLIDASGATTGSASNLLADLPERAFASVNFATAGFADGDWIVIEDDQAPGTVSGAKHLEVNRIKKIIDATHASLYYITVDRYKAADTARITKLLVIENVWIAGRGTITNTGTTTSQGGHGVRIGLAFNCGVDGVTIADVRNHAVHLEQTRRCSVTNSTFKDMPYFDGNGYGATTTSCVDTLIGFCNAYRTRHAYDISTFSRDTLVVGCNAYSSAYSAFQLHPKANRTRFADGIIDGVAGYDNATGTDLDDFGTQGHGVSVRENCEDFTLSNFTIKNTALSAIDFGQFGCSKLRAENVRISEHNMRGVLGGAAVYAADRNSSTADCPNSSLKDIEILGGYGVGVVCAYNDMQIDSVRVVGLQPGNQAPIHARSSGATSKCLPFVISGRNASASVLPGYTTLSGIQARDIIVRDSGAVAQRGLQIGGTDLVEAINGDWTLTMSDITVDGVEIRSTTKSGIWQQPVSNTISGHTVIVTHGTTASYLRHAKTFGCNTSADSLEAGIHVCDFSNIASTAVVHLEDCADSLSSNVGIRVGYNYQVLRRCHGDGVSSGGNGIGIWYRPGQGGQTLVYPTFEDCGATGNDGDGLRIGHASIGSVSGPLVYDGVFHDNGLTGIHFEVETSDARCKSPECYNNLIGIKARGATAMLVRPDCWNQSQNGIYVETGATDTVIREPVFNGNASSDVNDLGTRTRYEDSWWLTTGAAGTTTLKGPVQYHGVTGTSGGTITLPTAADVPDGHQVTIKDEGGSAGTTNITVQRASTDTIDGANTTVIAANYGSVTVKRRGAGKWFIL